MLEALNKQYKYGLFSGDRAASRRTGGAIEEIHGHGEGRHDGWCNCGGERWSEVETEDSLR